MVAAAPRRPEVEGKTLPEIGEIMGLPPLEAGQKLVQEDPSVVAIGFGMAEDGVTARDGSKPVNTSGGLKSKGHPVGASGVAQAVEIWKQMRGEAGARQVRGDIPLALAHNVGGTGNTCVVNIFERRH